MAEMGVDGIGVVYGGRANRQIIHVADGRKDQISMGKSIKFKRE